MPDDRQLLFQSGGYRKLKSFQLAQLCFDITAITKLKEIKAKAR
jgi:hypothetical protein